MPAYRVDVAQAAARQIRKLPRTVQTKIVQKIDLLERNPRPFGVEKLGGGESLYRVRVGDYRIIYTIEDRILRVLVVKVADRKDVYR